MASTDHDTRMRCLGWNRVGTEGLRYSRRWHGWLVSGEIPRLISPNSPRSAPRPMPLAHLAQSDVRWSTSTPEFGVELSGLLGG